jgi:hypothetical protein
MAYAAKMSNVNDADLSQGLKLLSRNMQEASEGTGTAADYFQAMGIEVTDTQGRLRPLGEMMGDIAAQFARWEDGPRKIAIALAIFGRSGEQLIPVLNQGRSGMEALWREAEKLGLILGESIIKKGSEADDVFKRINAQLLAMKENLAPAISGFAGLGEKIIAYLGPGFKKVGERLLGAPDDIERAAAEYWKKLEQYGEHRAKVSPPEIATPPEPNWIKKWVGDWDELTYAFEQLGIQSQASLVKAAQSAETYMKVIEANFQKGKATATDLKNAVDVAAAAYQKLIPPDTSKQRVDLEKYYQEAAKAISRDDPEFRKKIEALADSVNEQMKKIKGPDLADAKAQLDEYKRNAESTIQQTQTWIDANPLRAGVDLQELAKIKDGFGAVKTDIESNPIKPGVDVTGLQEIKTAFEQIKGEIESSSIKINVDTSALQNAAGGGAGGGGGGAWWSGLSPSGEQPWWVGGVESDVNVSFTGEGSTRMPLSDKINSLTGQFSGFQDMLSGMGVLIDFSEMTTQFQNLEKKLAALKDVFPSINRMVWMGGGDVTASFPLDFVSRVKQAQEDIVSQMGLLQMKMMMELFEAFMQSYQMGGYQTGGHVPKTGLYLLHKGEEVRTTSQQISVSNGGITFHIDGSRDPKATADQIVKALKYNLSGELSNALKRLR